MSLVYNVEIDHNDGIIFKTNVYFLSKFPWVQALLLSKLSDGILSHQAHLLW